MVMTKSWAESLGLSSEENLAPVEDYDEPCARSAQDVAIRSLILHGVVAVAAGVGAEPIVAWFQDQGILGQATSQEKEFLLKKKKSRTLRNSMACHMEAEWALLWVIGKVSSLGLPTKYCDSRKLVDEIIPELGADIGDFVMSSQLRLPGLLLAEDDRSYNLWCHAQKAKKTRTLPSDLNWTVLYERRYAFEWLDGHQEWDEVTCDA